MSTSALRIERDGPVLRVTMRKPERRNAFDAALIEELTSAFADVGDVRAVLLSGEGASFSAGADVDWMRSSVDLSFEDNVADALRLRAMLETIDSCAAPVVARVQGHALGGGCGLVACCDVVVADSGAQFAFSEVKLGIVPAVISPFALAKIGTGAARRYFVTGERFGADVALRIGLVHDVTDELDAAVERVIGELLTAGPDAARAAKELARAPLSARQTAELIAQHRTSAEGQEGLRAFLAKRAAGWHAAPE
jgi:methylglutaconyl-CoA hydratase